MTEAEIARPALLLVDPDAGLRDSLGDQLEQEGFVTRREAALSDAGDAALILLGPGALAAALARGAHGAPMLVLLDAEQLPPPDGAVAAWLRRPVRLAELVALIRRLLAEGAARPIGPYWFEPAAKLLRDRDRGRTVRLTEKEVAMLDSLSRAGSAGLSREKLLAEVWGYSETADTHTLETHIYRLRRKIERDPAVAEILITEPGGYRLAP